MTEQIGCYCYTVSGFTPKKKKQARAAHFETQAVWEKLYEDGALYLSVAVKFFFLKFFPIAFGRGNAHLSFANREMPRRMNIDMTTPAKVSSSHLTQLHSNRVVLYAKQSGGELQ